MKYKGLTNAKMFGVIALSMGMITSEQLQQCLDIQQETTNVRRRLGSIILARGYMTESQVREVLSLQGKTGETTVLPADKRERRKLLGEILVERGFIDNPTLTKALRRQQLLRKTGINPRLGELLIAIGQISRQQLREALGAQSGTQVSA